MSLDTTSIDKEIARLVVEALMLWELPKVENALNDLCQSWFWTDYSKIRGIVDITDTQKPPTASFLLRKRIMHRTRFRGQTH